MLVAIFGEKDSHAVYYLHQQGVTRLDVVNFISHGVRKDNNEPIKSSEGAEDMQGEAPQKKVLSTNLRKTSISSPQKAALIH